MASKAHGLSSTAPKNFLKLTKSPSWMLNNLTSNGKHLAYCYDKTIVMLSEQRCISGLSASSEEANKDHKVDMPPWDKSSKGSGNHERFECLNWCSVGASESSDVAYFLVAGTSLGRVCVFSEADLGSSFWTWQFEMGFNGYPVVVAVDKAYDPETDSSFLIMASANGKLAFASRTKGLEFSAEYAEKSTLPSKEFGSITAIGSNDRSGKDRSFWCAGDAEGAITVWKGRQVHETFSGDGNPITALNIQGQVVVAGSSTGRIFVLDATAGKQLDIAAHAQCVTAVRIHRDLGVFASVSDDSILEIWNFDEKDLQSAKIVSSAHLPDSKLVGVEFATPRRDVVAVTAFDALQLVLWDLST